MRRHRYVRWWARCRVIAVAWLAGRVAGQQAPAARARTRRLQAAREGAAHAVGRS